MITLYDRDEGKIGNCSSSAARMGGAASTSISEIVVKKENTDNDSALRGSSSQTTSRKRKSYSKHNNEHANIRILSVPRKIRKINENHVLVINSDDDDDSEYILDFMKSSSNQKNQNACKTDVLCSSGSLIIELSDSEDVGIISAIIETAQIQRKYQGKCVNVINRHNQQFSSNLSNVNVKRRNLRKGGLPQKNHINYQEPGTSCQQSSSLDRSRSPLSSHSHSISYLPLDSNSTVAKTGLRPIIIDGSNVAFGYTVEYASKTGGVIVTRDNYKDLLVENEAWKDTINFRILQYTFVGDMIMFPKDPLGRNGPPLDQFLMF